jgi:hypothetical protein
MSIGAQQRNYIPELWIAWGKLSNRMDGEDFTRFYINGKYKNDNKYLKYAQGYVPGLIGTLNGAVQFAIYNWLKDWRCQKLGIARDSQLVSQTRLTFLMVFYEFRNLKTICSSQHCLNVFLLCSLFLTNCSAHVYRFHRRIWLFILLTSSGSTRKIQGHTRLFGADL